MTGAPKKQALPRWQQTAVSRIAYAPAHL